MPSVNSGMKEICAAALLTNLISMINLRSALAGAITKLLIRLFTVAGMSRSIGIVHRASYLSPIAQWACELLHIAAGA